MLQVQSVLLLLGGCEQPQADSTYVDPVPQQSQRVYFLFDEE
jgi:hypothetical protein